MFWKMRRPFKHKIIDKFLSNRNSFLLLDIGCWRFSPTEFKRSFPNCRYFGLDMQEADQDSLKLMEKFYNLNLITDSLDSIPNLFFDVIVLSHVIEHLPNGKEVIIALLSKIKPGGIIYIEYPSVKSLRLPSRPDTLNFCDDPTHLTLYSTREIGNILLSKNFKILKAGPRRDTYRILMMPIVMLWQLFRYKTVYSYVLWDALSFAEFIIAEKKS